MGVNREIHIGAEDGANDKGMTTEVDQKNDEHPSSTSNPPVDHQASVNHHSISNVDPQSGRSEPHSGRSGESSQISKEVAIRFPQNVGSNVSSHASNASKLNEVVDMIVI